MTYRGIVNREQAGNKGQLWLDSHGHLYSVPCNRAELAQALHLQRRITDHLARVIRFLAASKGGAR